MKLSISILAILAAAALLWGCAAVPNASTPPSTAPGKETTGTAAPTQSLPPTVPSDPATVPTDPPADPVSILNFLKIAASPVGSTMYIWGGGWNEEDTGAGIEAVTLGLSPAWAEFAALQGSDYDYNDFRYHIHKGLDCSGYAGWAVYNILETENGREGYVCSSTAMAKNLADRGLGTYIPAEEMTQWLPGDIMSMKGHVWIAVGQCGDGSVLLLHASPPGVIFSGTALPDGSESEAVRLAQTVMQTHFPDWYARFPDCSRPHSYLTASSAMRWSVLADDEGIRDLTAEEVVSAIFAAE